MVRAQQPIGPPSTSCSPYLGNFPLWHLNAADESRSEPTADEQNAEVKYHRSAVSPSQPPALRFS